MNYEYQEQFVFDPELPESLIDNVVKRGDLVADDGGLVLQCTTHIPRDERKYYWYDLSYKPVLLADAQEAFPDSDSPLDAFMAKIQIESEVF